MLRSFACQSLSELPRALTLTKTDKIYVTLPVLVLAFQKLNVGVLLVTDFTEIPDLGFANNQLPQSLPDCFVFNEKVLNSFKVLAVGVPLYRVEQVWNELQDFGPQMKNYDYSRDARCDLLPAGVIAILNFKISVYNGYLEGFLGKITVLNRARINSQECFSEIDRGIFDRYMARFLKNMDCGLYDRMIGSFPIETFVVRKTLPGNWRSPRCTAQLAGTRHVHSEHDETNQPAPIKSRKLNPSAAIYQQQVTQPPATAATSRPCEKNELNQADDKTHDTQVFEADTSVIEWSRNRVNDVTFQQFSQVDCSKMIPGTCLRFKCTIQEIWPPAEDIFVKAFRKTLEIVQLKFVLTDTKSTSVIEINTNDEGCEFFGLDEVEDAINHIESFAKSVKLLVSKEVTMEVEAKSMTLPLGHTYMYWCPVSQLSDLVAVN